MCLGAKTILVTLSDIRVVGRRKTSEQERNIRMLEVPDAECQTQQDWNSNSTVAVETNAGSPQVSPPSAFLASMHFGSLRRKCSAALTRPFSAASMMSLPRAAEVCFKVDVL